MLFDDEGEEIIQRFAYSVQPMELEVRVCGEESRVDYSHSSGRPRAGNTSLVFCVPAWLHRAHHATLYTAGSNQVRLDGARGTAPGHG